MQSSDVNGSFLAPSAVAAAQESDYENVPVGPMERRNRKKKQQKRRSASLSRVFTATVKGIQKAMSRSTTPTRHATFVPNEFTAAASFHCTPLPTHRKVCKFLSFRRRFGQDWLTFDSSVQGLPIRQKSC